MAKKSVPETTQITPPSVLHVAGEAAAPDMSIETITPALAKDWLELNIINRKPASLSIAAYARDMVAGRWQLTGDAIRFNTEGKLFDGQHRLLACIRAKTPFTSIVMRNLPPETVEVIDSGRGRRAADILAMRGIPNSFVIAAATRWLMVMRHGLQGRDGMMSILKPTHEEVLEIVDRHPDLIESSRILKRPLGINPSLLVALHYVGANLLGKKALADAFANVFNKGEPYYQEHDPALKLRELAMRKQQENTQFTQRALYVNTVYTFNAFMEGRALPVFRPPETIAVRGLDPNTI